MFKFLFCCLIAIASSESLAWQPTGPIKVIVGQGPGGGNELAMRGIAPIIERNNPGVSFIIESRPGLDNVIAMNYFAEQKADGQTILVTVTETSFISAPVVYKSQIRVSPNEYVPVTMIARSPMAFIVPINSPIKTVPDLVAYLKDKTHKFNVGLSGSTNLLAYSYFINKLKLDPVRIQAINYNSPLAAALGVASKDLDMAIVSISSPKALIGTKVRLLAYTGNHAIPGLEEFPLMKQYVPGLSINASWSVFLPPGTPPDITAWYNEQFKQALTTTEARGYFYSNWASIDSNAVGSQGLVNNITLLKQQWSNIADQVLIEKK